MKSTDTKNVNTTGVSAPDTHYPKKDLPNETKKDPNLKEIEPKAQPKVDPAAQSDAE